MPNTFLPYEDFDTSARCLDDSRLFKQAVEATSLVAALTTGKPAMLARSVAAKMWVGYVPRLKVYTNAILLEVIRRGKWKLQKLRMFDLVASGEVVEANTKQPAWMGNKTFHASHRSNLLRKDAKHYGQFGWTERPTLPYVWPKSGNDSLKPKASTKPPVGKRLV